MTGVLAFAIDLCIDHSLSMNLDQNAQQQRVMDAQQPVVALAAVHHVKLAVVGHAVGCCAAGPAHHPPQFHPN